MIFERVIGVSLGDREIDSKRRLTIPSSLAPATLGDRFEASFDAEEVAFVFRRLSMRSDWLAVLTECPVSMDDVPLRRGGVAKHRPL